MSTAVIETTLPGSQRDVGAAEEPCRALILQNHIEGMRPPVWNVGRVAKLAIQLNITVEEIGCVEYGIDVKDTVVREHYRTIRATQFECLLNRWDIIHSIAKMRRRIRVEVAGGSIIDNISRCYR